MAARNIANTLPDNEEDEKKHPAKSDRESALDLGKIATARLKSSDANDKEYEMHS